MNKIALILILGLLAACLPGPARKAAVPGAATGGIAGAVITTQALPAPGGSGGAVPAPAATPPAKTSGATASGATAAAAEPGTDAPVAPASPAAPPAFRGKASFSEGAACLKQGGQWAPAGQSGAMACVRPTRDGGKSCRSKRDCQGECLSRSMSCAPIMPLFGCNEIVTEGGLVVTQCVD